MKVYSEKLAEALTKALKDVRISEATAENGEFEVIATTQDVDRHGEAIRIDGWEMENYMKNPIILFGHDYWNMDSIVGRATEIRFEGGKMIVKGVFASGEANPKAQQLRKLYEEGIVKTVSVGFIPRQRDEQDRDVITKAELLEISFVPVPANPEALSLMKGLGIDPEEFSEEDVAGSIRELKELVVTLSGEVAGIKKILVDGKTYSDAEKEAKEALQTIDRVVGDTLRSFRQKKR